MEFRITVLSSAALSTGLGAAVVWLMKTWIEDRLTNSIKHEYDAKLEKLKAENDKRLEQYKHHAEEELETLKSALQIMANEHQVRFNKLHEVRACVIAELYSKTVAHECEARELIYKFYGIDDASRKDRVGEIAKKYRDSRKYYLEHKIYFGASTCEKLDAYYQQISEVSVGFSIQFLLGPHQRVKRDTKCGTRHCNQCRRKSLL